MHELTKSIGSLSWALSLFGIRQLASLARPTEATRAFDEVSRAAQRELGPELRSTFEAGDRLQRGMVDLTFGLLGFDLLDPRRWTEGALRWARRTAGDAGCGGCGDREPANRAPGPAPVRGEGG